MYLAFHYRYSYRVKNLKFKVSLIFYVFRSYEMLSKMVAGKQLKMLHNVKKRQDKNKRLRTAKEQNEDDEDDNEMAALMPSKPKPER